MCVCVCVCVCVREREHTHVCVSTGEQMSGQEVTSVHIHQLNPDPWDIRDGSPEQESMNNSWLNRAILPGG